MGMEMHRVRIKDGSPVAGLAENGTRLRLMPGEYEAHWLSRGRPGMPPDHSEGVLRFLNAVEGGGHIDVFSADWVELKLWPQLPAKSRFEVVLLGE